MNLSAPWLELGITEVEYWKRKYIEAERADADVQLTREAEMYKKWEAIYMAKYEQWKKQFSAEKASVIWNLEHQLKQAKERLGPAGFKMLERMKALEEVAEAAREWRDDTEEECGHHLEWQSLSKSLIALDAITEGDGG